MGREARKPVDVLRTLAWLENLKAISGLQTGYAIGRFVDGPGKQPRAWMSYDNAEGVPLIGNHPSAAVARAERLWPDSALRFISPIWKVLNGERLTRRELDVGLLLISPQVRSIFFKERRGLFHRRVFDLCDMSRVWELHSFEGIVASVLLMEEAVLAHSPILREAGFELYETLRPHMIDVPDLARIWPYLFTSIDSMMPRWLCVGTNGRKDVRFCWRHELWARDFHEQKLEYPWLLQQLDCGLPPNVEDIRYTRKVIPYGAASYPMPLRHR